MSGEERRGKKGFAPSLRVIFFFVLITPPVAGTNRRPEKKKKRREGKEKEWKGSVFPAASPKTIRLRCCSRKEEKGEKDIKDRTNATVNSYSIFIPSAYGIPKRQRVGGREEGKEEGEGGVLVFPSLVHPLRSRIKDSDESNAPGNIERKRGGKVGNLFSFFFGSKRWPSPVKKTRTRSGRHRGGKRKLFSFCGIYAAGGKGGRGGGDY